jgi:PTH1 family peptidyl-tRNA hydrolase
VTDFAKSEQSWVEALCKATAAEIPLLVKGDDAHFQSKVHLAMEAAGFNELNRVGVRE